MLLAGLRNFDSGVRRGRRGGKEVSIRNRWIGFALVVVLACLFPMSVQGQCVTTATMQTTVGMTILVTKSLSASAVCTLTGGMNIVGCVPSGAATTSVLMAGATTGAATPSCAWTCACGAVVIDGSDGLPVELMDFGIEDESEDVGAEEESEPVEEEGGSAQDDSS